VLSGRGLCNGLITHPEESYRMWCMVVWDLETSPRMRRPWPALGCSAMGWGSCYKSIKYCLIRTSANKTVTWYEPSTLLS